MTEVSYAEWISEIPSEEAEYYRNIEEYFGRRGGFPWIVRGRDWVLARSWFERGIPLHVIYRAIDEFFDKFGYEEAPRFLGFVENFVKKHWRLYRMATIGHLAETGRLHKISLLHVRRWFDGWRNQMAQAAARARREGLNDAARVIERRQSLLKRVERLIPETGSLTGDLAETLEQKLENFEKTLRRELMAALPDDYLSAWRERIRQELAHRLQGYLSETQRRRLLEETLKRRVWLAFRLPDFTILRQLAESLQQPSLGGPDERTQPG